MGSLKKNDQPKEGCPYDNMVTGLPRQRDPATAQPAPPSWANQVLNAQRAGTMVAQWYPLPIFFWFWFPLSNNQPPEKGCPYDTMVTGLPRHHGPEEGQGHDACSESIFPLGNHFFLFLVVYIQPKRISKHVIIIIIIIIKVLRGA